MVLSGLGVFLFRRDLEHCGLWFILILYWWLGGVLQDFLGTNSIPYYNAFLSLSVALAAAQVSRYRQITWPFWVAFLMVLTAISDCSAMLADIMGNLNGTFSYYYQRLTYLFFYISLLALALRQPNKNRTKKHAKRNWRLFA